MIPSPSIAALLVVFLAHGIEADVGCDYPTPVTTFADAFYAAVAVTQNRTLVETISLPGTEAAKNEYELVLDILGRRNVCSGHMVAFTGSRALALVETATLAQYLLEAGIDLGQLLAEKGLLHCGNAVSLALDYYRYFARSLAGLDPTSFRSWQYAADQGMVDFLDAHGLSLDDVSQKLADIFYQAYEDEVKKMTPKNGSGDACPRAL